jgi:hypothetical protein
MRVLLGGLLLLLALPSLARAQDSVIIIDPDQPLGDSAIVRAGPPPDVVAEVLASYNDSATTRMEGDVSFPPGSSFAGRLALYRGSLRLAGRVRGDVVVVNATLYLLPGAEVEGDVLVVGGRLIRSPEARHVGRERVTWDAAPVLRTADGTLVMRERRRRLGELATARTTFQTGKVRTTLLLATGGTYNRVEGLPIVFGPTFELRPSHATSVRLDLRGILRTAGEGGGRNSAFGYGARAEFRFPGGGVAGRLYDDVVPFEDLPLSAAENGWSAFLLQRDYRDWYERQGGGGSVWIQPTRTVRVEVSMRRDHESSLRAVDPWSLFRNSDRWRRNPLIDDGHYFTTGLQAELDTRNDRDAPTTGWYLRGRYEHSTSDDVAPVTLPEVVRPPIPTGGGYAFDRLSLDFRRYSRLTPNFRVNARVRAEGWIGGGPLSIQRRVSLGGPDPLPGYAFRELTCAPRGFSDVALPALCDRSLLAQVEARTRLRLNLGYRLHDSESGAPGRFIGIEEADLVFFSDAGKAWLAGNGPEQVPTNRIPSFHEWKADVGVGMDAGQIGAYLAKSLSGDDPVRFVVRLQRRF